MSTFLQFFPTPLLDDLVNNRAVPLVGAGFSLNARLSSDSEMPDWNKLGKYVASLLPEYEYNTALDAISAYAHEYSRPRLVELLQSALHIDSAKPGEAHRAFCELPFELVVTTNFDFLLEHAYASLGRTCTPLVEEGQLAVNPAHPCVQLIKLHGDLHHPQRLVVTEEDYDGFIARNPLLSTFVANLLIGKTALLIGYSLDDHDFRQIWQLVRDRLGGLRRPAYALQVGAKPQTVARFERRGVKVINLPKSRSRSYSATLAEAFSELREYWPPELLSRSMTTDEDAQAELALAGIAEGRMCFFSVPLELAAFYRKTVFPVAEEYGFQPIVAEDVIAPGDSLAAKLYALIGQSQAVVVEVGSLRGLSELRTARALKAAEALVVVVPEGEVSGIPDVGDLEVIQRPRDVLTEVDAFARSMSTWFAKASERLSQSLYAEPVRLLGKREYRAAVISAFTLLESELRTSLAQREAIKAGYRISFHHMLEVATSHGLLARPDRGVINELWQERNALVHTSVGISSAKARRIVDQVMGIVTRLREDGQ